MTYCESNLVEWDKASLDYENDYTIIDMSVAFLRVSFLAKI